MTVDNKLQDQPKRLNTNGDDDDNNNSNNNNNSFCLEVKHQ